MELDSTDKQILNILQKDAKLPVKEIAQLVNLSTTPVFQRIKRMEKNGIIESYSAVLNRSKIAQKTTIFAEVNLHSHSGKDIEQFEKIMTSTPEITECYHITGKSDYLLKIEVDSMNTYRKFIMGKISTIENIAHLNSSITLEEVKRNRHLEI